ncbi:MAG: DUF3237 family protein [Fibrobacteria bacterium]
MARKSRRMVFLGLIGLAFSQATAQGEVSGIVRDSRTSQPISGAAVRLLGLGLSASTDTGGRFTLTAASGLGKPLLKGGPLAGARSGSILYRQESDGPIHIRVLDLWGRQRAVVFSGPLARGDWNISLPVLPPGTYLCDFATPQGRRRIRFLASLGMEAAPHREGKSPVSRIPPSPGGAAKASAAPVDSLRISKNGYRPAQVPIAGFPQKGMDISLEDSAVVDLDAATLIPDPSWTCYRPEGIPPPSLGEAAFTLTFQIGAIREVGLTKFGRRRQFDIQGGAIKGSRIDGTVLIGGLDYELTLSNGSTEVEQIGILRADNVPILMRNAGAAPPGAKNARVVLDFEAPNSSAFAWLNTGRFAATRIVDTAAKTIRLEVFDISKTAPPAARITLKDPGDAPNQTWDCFTLTGGQGASVFTENVTLGTSISIGASKRGSRNIIPITGGTTTGKVKGKILPGGADYQLTGLDARYTLAPDDGELIIVRNCGTGGLVPVFEARVDGPYAFLNENKYLSSAPGTGSGGVSITFYEKK